MLKGYHMQQSGYHVWYENNDCADAEDRRQGKQVPAHHHKIKSIKEKDIQDGSAHPKDTFRTTDSFVDPIQFLRIFKGNRILPVNRPEQNLIGLFYDLSVQNLPITVRHAVHSLRKSICRS